MAAVVIADPAPIKKYYEQFGLVPNNLDKCNSQQICRGAKVGKGYFLTTSNKWDEYPDVTITIFPDTIALNLRVINSLSLDSNHIILCTEEKKSDLLKKVVDYDYNVIDQLARPDLKYFLKPADQSVTTITATAKTFEEIVDDILSSTSSGYTAVHPTKPDPSDPEGPAISSYPDQDPMNVFVEGMNVLEALEYLLTPIGHTFIVVGTEVRIIRPNLANPELYESYELGIENNRDLAVAFPINKQFADNQGTRHNFYVKKTNDATGVGTQDAVYYPFLYQLRDDSDVVTNTADIDSMFTWLQDNYRLTDKQSFYIVPKFDAAYATRFFETVTFVDKGDRPVTIYEHCPLLLPRIPAAPPISQSVGLFKFTLTSAFASSRYADAAIYEPFNLEQKHAGRRIIDVAGTMGGLGIGATGMGLRVGEQFYAIATSDDCLPDTILAEYQVTASAFQIKTYTRSTCTLSAWTTVFSFEDCTA